MVGELAVTYWDGATGKTNADCSPSGNNTSCGSDRHKTSDHSLHCTENRGLLVVDHIADCPAKQRHGGRDVGVENGCTSVCGSGVWITTIETVPADPEDACSDQYTENVIWTRIFAISRQTRTDPVGAYETCCPRRYVDDISTGIIDHAALEEESTAPKTVGSNRVREGDPERDEDHPSVEVHAAQESTCHDDDGDGCENKLEIHHGAEGEVLAQSGGWQAGLLEFLRHGHDGTGASDEG